MLPDNSPKIHFIQNPEGKYWNSVDKLYSSELALGTYVSEKDKSKYTNLLLTKFTDHKLYTTTELMFMQELSTLTVDAVFAGELLSNLLNRLNCKIPTISQVNKTMRNKIVNTIEALKPFRDFHTAFLIQNEDDTDEVSGRYAEMVNQLSKLHHNEYDELTVAIKAIITNRK